MLGIAKGKNLKLLYLLALFQLVAGPLVLFQVTVLCKLTVREVPRENVATAIQKAWKSNEFQAALGNAHSLKKDIRSPVPTPDPNAEPVKAKMPFIAWATVPVLIFCDAECVPCSDWARMWTPTWPQAPPAPPPRIG